ncbi:methylated-DNA--[protein]-cysteine S-methyltransferase [Lactobacillus sp. ESL0731]|uniref:methylated-DNA--[protein]-cysteine S-methyltransferase n=1 Tax=unclassified Lactobacillus TaxID=2620435 RepID=UPI0023F716C6|nr:MULTISPECIES: methylated-DNA--[protein]-cysteine S-methyltransferase [unclassified Lactobacillus]WEV51242.1 methylated-DNA--[protein]-cysteine S-methyltransferase [Lactobacillus sp. ESL0700]WEV62372.1 methylated-DNA--[protein]-cysteine S-methyltransferase [Lactobacillus sp. ESL0731]
MLYYADLAIDHVTFQLVADESGLTYVGQTNAATLPLSHFYPNEKLLPDPPDPARLTPYVQELREFLTGTREEFDVPLSISRIVTPWQRKVLEQVRQIPYGQTISYQELAQAIGQPQAVRAVAHAVALNPVLFFIPCHRVIRADGTYGQYRLGNNYKKHLINLEKSF